MTKKGKWKNVEEAKKKKEKDDVSSKGEIKYVEDDVVSNPVLSKNQQSLVLTWVSKK
jgi:hypothetical protein